MIGRKGQAFTAMKLVQGAVVALVLLGIVYGILQVLKGYEPGSNVLVVSSELLSSAYAAAGTGQSFSRRAKLVPQFITGDSVKEMAGIDDPNLNVEFACVYPVAKVKDGNMEDCKVCKKGSCTSYDSVSLKPGSEIDVCVYCEDPTHCTIYLGTRDCPLS